MAWLAGYRRLRVRYERRADILLGFLQLACALICRDRLDRPSTAPRGGRRRAGERADQPAALRTRSALRVSISLGPDRPQSTTSTGLDPGPVPGGRHQDPPGCQRPSARRRRTSERYVASAWVRSTAPGQQVVLRLVGNGGKQSAEASATTLPGLAWRRVIVAHTATAQTDLSLEITSNAVHAGDSLLVDEVVIRRG